MTADHQALATLLAEVRACTVCRSASPLEPRPVVRVDARARILIAGQAPGRGAHESGVPFDDASGDRLREWMGIDRDTFYDAGQIAILPMGFCYPGTGSSGDLPPRAECVPLWRAPLLASLKRFGMPLITGAYAQEWHLGAAAGYVTALVRDWRSTWPTRIALPHPSPRNNIWLEKNPWFVAEVVPALRTHVAALLS
ncbi:uracil-DNA glycosylase family protein [Gemmatimonas sp.]|uniref:uracil-DNA glycosylase family protein n=1 Tax=Gemmatimonas sp. TaxID=1962908 RepID=UPI003563F511